MAESNVRESAVADSRFRRYPEYRDSRVDWLGEIPAHWELRRLKTAAEIQLSNVDKKTVTDQVPVRLCNYVDVYYNDKIVSDMDFMSASASGDQVARFTLRKGDVLITKDSETPNDIAVSAVVAEDLPGVVCGYHLAHIRPGAMFDGNYLARAFMSYGLRDQFRVAANGITSFGLTSGTIGDSLFPLPPLVEQRAIAAFLDRRTGTIDGLLGRKKRLTELLREESASLIARAVHRLVEYRSALISAAVTGRIDVG